MAAATASFKLADIDNMVTAISSSQVANVTHFKNCQVPWPMFLGCLGVTLKVTNIFVVSKCESLMYKCSLIPWSQALENPPVAQLLKNFLTFYRT
jgi:hypothetical protein